MKCLENKYICVFEGESLKGTPELLMMVFPDFISGWEWVQENKEAYPIIAFAETINFRG